MDTPEQVVLSREQLEAFDFDGFVESQHNALRFLLNMWSIKFQADDYIVDVGGGRGYFARRIQEIHGKVKVYETDPKSIDRCLALGIEAHMVDALRPIVVGDEKLVCLNLILHHLIGDDEVGNKRLQESALLPWKDQYIFVHEYCYQSFWGRNWSGRLIYEITSSRLLSAVGKFVANFAPSLRANTFGIGVRFRSSIEWVKFFEQRGFRVLGVVAGEEEVISPARRVLFIKSIRRDSFLIKFNRQPMTTP